ncbi:MAG: hypothetical protein AMXMBFR83_19760 [Phycisphaerae bacterium]
MSVRYQTHGPRLSIRGLTAVLWMLAAAGPARAGYDPAKYISPDELRPGMKGYGRTVMSGGRIERFNVEVIAVMRNAFYAKQDVILVRCSGLNLEHTGIIGGMSGSPCYIVDEGTGAERMMGAVAYGWTFNKDPICGVQPITQMLPIPEVRMPAKPILATQAAAGEEPPRREEPSGRSAGWPLGELVGRVWPEPIDEASAFSVLNDDVQRLNRDKPKARPPAGALRPLTIPVMVSGGSGRSMDRLRRSLERFGFEPVASGAASEAVKAQYADLKLEPGSALCIPMMTGDMMMEGLGTCTEVLGDKVLGFGHSMFSMGNIELPLATGIVHTVIPSVARSEKMGAALKVVGTLYGDENTGIFGIVGAAPAMIPLEVTVTDVRGTRTYRYQVMREDSFTPMLLMNGVWESVLAHSDPPEEHTVRYQVEVEYEGLGTFKSANFTSQRGAGGAATDMAMPAMSLMNAPFGKAKVKSAKAQVTVEKGARAASFDEVILPRTLFKPGETVEARVRWFHYRRDPAYTHATYALDLPADLPDGDYELAVCSPRVHVMASRAEKPHLYRADTLAEALAAFNRLASCPDNGVYLRLALPAGGLAVDQTEMPELPSFRRQILADSRRSDIQRYSEVKAVRFDTDFAVTGERTFRIRVSRRAGQ